MTSPLANVWQPRLGSLIEYSPKNIILAHENPTSDNPASREFVYFPFDVKVINKIFMEDKNLYEILPEKLPRKFPVDIDIKPEHKNYDKYTYPEIIDAMTTVVQYCYGKIANGEIIDISKIISSIVVKIDRKQSLHIIYPINFENQTDSLLFAKYVELTIQDCTVLEISEAQKILKNDDEIYFDRSIYSINQNLRMIYQSKKKYPGYTFQPFNSDIKEPIYYLAGIYENAKTTTYVDCISLEGIIVPKIYKKICDKSTLDEDKLKNYYLQTISAYFKEFSSIVQYEEYPKPNDEAESVVEFLLSCIPNLNSNPQSYQLWYSLGQTLKNIAVDKKLDEKIYLQYWINWSNKASETYKNEDKICKDVWNHMIVRSGPKYMKGFLYKIANYYYPDGIYRYKSLNLVKDLFIDEITGFDYIETYNERYCRYNNLDDYKGILIKSAMATGKTRFVTTLAIEKNYKRILLVSPRKAYSLNKTSELKKIFGDFIDYTQLDENNRHSWLRVNKLGIQFESLKHLGEINEDTKPDLLILDEIESILTQVSSSTNGSDSKSNFATLIKMIKLCDKFVMADAFVLARSVNFTKEIQKLTNTKIMMSINEYMHLERTAIILGISTHPIAMERLQVKLLEHIIKSLRDNKKICVCIWSKTFKQVILEAVKKDFGVKYLENSIKNYDGDSDNIVMKDIEDVTKAWSPPEIRMVIYTSKITVGVDFSEKDVFDRTYVYGSSSCPIARDMLQGHFRVRHLKENTIYVAIHADSTFAHRYASLTQETTKNRFIDNKFNTQSNNLYKMVCDYNSLEEEIGRYAYDKVFLRMLKDTGYTIEYDTHYEENDTTILKELKLEAYTSNLIKNYHCLKELRDDDYTIFIKIEELQFKVMKGKATKKECLMLNAYNFNKFIIGNTWMNELKDDEILELITNPELFKKLTTAAIACDLPLKIYIESELFNIYYFKREKKQQIINMIKELKKIDIVNLMRTNRNKVKSDQKEILKLESIRHLCNFLQLKNSIDTLTKVSEETVLEYYKYYKNMSIDIKNIFEDNFMIGELKAKTDILKAKQLINLIFKNWNGCGFIQIFTKQVRSNSKRIRLYDYFVCKNEDAMMSLLYSALVI